MNERWLESNNPLQYCWCKGLIGTGGTVLQLFALRRNVLDVEVANPAHMR